MQWLGNGTINRFKKMGIALNYMYSWEGIDCLYSDEVMYARGVWIICRVMFAGMKNNFIIINNAKISIV